MSSLNRFSMERTRNYEKFERVYEAYYSKYAAGIFSPNDVVEFDLKALKSNESYKALQPQLQAKLLAMAESQQRGESVVCVVAIDINPFIHDTYAPSTITLGYSMGGGRYTDMIAVPGSICDCLSIVEDPIGNQVSTLPPLNRKDYIVDPKRKEVDLEELEKHRRDGYARSIFDPLGTDIKKAEKKTEKKTRNASKKKK